MMFIPQLMSPPAGERRPGVILLIVISLLTLFAVVGLSFVFYAESEATAARYARASGNYDKADDDPEQLLSFFLSQLLFDTADNASAVRGHSLSRGMYGLNTEPLLPNTTPFNGVGRLRYTVDWWWNPPPVLPFPGPAFPPSQNNVNLINYQRFLGDTIARDPELIWSRPAPPSGVPPVPNNGLYAGGANVPWTYPDLDNLPLGAINGKGEVLIQSYHRSWTGVRFRPNNPPRAPYNDPLPTAVDPDAPWQKYLTLRPHPSYHPNFGPSVTIPGFAAVGPVAGVPEDMIVVGTNEFFGGDVKNLDFSRGVRIPNTSPPQYFNNDSVWIDPNFPVRVAPNGKRYKPMFAMFMVDLDGKVNLNVAGNIRGTVNTHLSNMGYVPSEINLSKVLTQSDWVNLFTGSGNIAGRYGIDGAPSVTGQFLGTGNPPAPAPPLASPPYWAKVDIDGAENTPGQSPPLGPAYKYRLPGENQNYYANSWFNPFPYYPTTGNDPATGNPLPYTGPSYGDGIADERRHHPRLFNFFAPLHRSNIGGVGKIADDRVFLASNMEALLRYGGTNSPSLGSHLFRLSPQNFNNLLQRMSVTTHSFDFGRAGVTPWLSRYDPASPPAYTISDATKPYPVLPGGTNFPGATSLPTAGGEFGSDGREFYSAAFGLLRINANTLSEYPAPIAANNWCMDTTSLQYRNAVTDRQAMCKAIFERLRFVTTGARPGDTLPATTTAEYAAMRWLAQLAVNIVDFHDSDDYITPFNWDTANPTTGWVFGVELPRLVINEAYAEIANDPADPKDGGTMFNRATRDYHVNFWVELLNPLLRDTSANSRLQEPILKIPSAVRLQLTGQALDPAGTQKYSHYRLVIGSGTTPDTYPAGVKLQVSDFTPDTAPIAGVDTNLVLPVDHPSLGGVDPGPDPIGYAGCVGKNPGLNRAFFVLGPADPLGIDGKPVNPFPGTNPNKPSPTLKVKVQDPYNEPFPASGAAPAPRSAMMYKQSFVDGKPVTPPGNHNIVLQRLACPHLPYQPDAAVAVADPTKPYNPYITVDYITGVPTWDGVTADGTDTPPKAAAFTERKAKGRRQPYRATPLEDQRPDSDPLTPNVIDPYTDMPQHTFFRHNGVELTNPNPTPTYPQGQSLDVPFDWLVHLDRPMVSPLDLLQVSSYKPHELTQQFITSAGRFRHLPFSTTGTLAWFDQEARLYRLFEFLDTGHRAAGVTLNGRFPGKVNINTMWDKEIFRALADARPATIGAPGVSSFTETQVDSIFDSLVRFRSPSYLTQAAVSSTDRPFRGLAAGHVPVGTQYPNGLGIDDTFFRKTSATNAAPLFAITPNITAATNMPLLTDTPPGQTTANRLAQNPYLQLELMSKIFNNVTTRSNVFAVWVTVGFFEVGPDTVCPIPIKPGMTQMPVASVDGIEVGDKVVVDPGANFEVATVILIDPVTNVLTVTTRLPATPLPPIGLRRPHLPGAVVHVGLKKELGRSEGRHIRHRMFAIVDRSNLMIPRLTTTAQAITGTPLPGPQTPQWVAVTAISGNATLGAPNQVVSYPFNIQTGMQLLINPNNAAAELVTVQNVDATKTPPQILAVFQNNHVNGVSVAPAGLAASANAVYGNPGPQVNFSHRNNANIVLHYSIIQ